MPILRDDIVYVVRIIWEFFVRLIKQQILLFKTNEAFKYGWTFGLILELGAFSLLKERFAWEAPLLIMLLAFVPFCYLGGVILTLLEKSEKPAKRFSKSLEKWAKSPPASKKRGKRSAEDPAFEKRRKRLVSPEEIEKGVTDATNVLPAKKRRRSKGD